MPEQIEQVAEAAPALCVTSQSFVDDCPDPLRVGAAVGRSAAGPREMAKNANALKMLNDPNYA